MSVFFGGTGNNREVETADQKWSNIGRLAQGEDAVSEALRDVLIKRADAVIN